MVNVNPKKKFPLRKNCFFFQYLLISLFIWLDNFHIKLAFLCCCSPHTLLPFILLTKQRKDLSSGLPTYFRFIFFKVDTVHIQPFPRHLLGLLQLMTAL